MAALVKCQEQGKIQNIGYVNVTPVELSEALAVHRVDALQVPYNLGYRDIEGGTIQHCAGLGIAVLVYGPLAQGLLTGKYDRNAKFDVDDRRHRLNHFQGAEMDRYLRIVDRLKEVALGYGKSPAQVALRWVLDNQFIAGTIVGAKTPDQVAENVGAIGWKLSAEDMAYLES